MAVASSRPVEIVVNDTPSRRTVYFRCDLDLLRCNMRYFDPIIRKQLDVEGANQCGASEGKDNPTGVFVPTESGCITSSAELVSIKVNCDVDVFHWLFDWMMASKKPVLRPSIVVSILLSSSFLVMSDLVEVALHYLCDHFVEVILSEVDMSCLTGELVGRLCSIITDADLARWYLCFHQSGKENHPNRSFMTSLLWHWVIDRVGYAVFRTQSPSDGGRCGVPSLRKAALRQPEPRDAPKNEGAARRSAQLVNDSKKGNSSRNQPRAGEFSESENHTSYNEFKGENNGGLRWCCLCGMLYDNQEYRRIVRSTAHTGPRGGASLNDRRTISSPLLLSLKEPLCTGLSFPKGGPSMGPRGAILTTHTPSRLLVSLEPPSPQLKSRAVEHWAWQIIGVMWFVSCSCCKRILPLIEVASHHCKSATNGVEFAPAERIAPDTRATSDVYSLIHWYEHMARTGVYREEGNLEPIRCPLSMTGLLKAERISLSSPGVKQQRTSFLITDRPSSSYAVRTYTWDTHPTAVDEVVMNGIVSPPSHGNGRLVDVDVQNHYERQFMNALTVRLPVIQATSLSLPAKPQELHHESNPIAAFQAQLLNFTDGNSVSSECTSSRALRTGNKSRYSGVSRASKPSGKATVLSVYSNSLSTRNSRFHNHRRNKDKMLREVGHLPHVTAKFKN